MATDFRLRLESFLLFLITISFTQAFYIPGMSAVVPRVDASGIDADGDPRLVDKELQR